MKSKMNCYRRYSFCQSSTELHEKCSRLDLMALFPNTVNADTGPVLVFRFVLFHVAEEVNTCPKSECLHWEEEVKAMKKQGWSTVSPQERVAPAFTPVWVSNCNTLCKKARKKKSSLDPYSLPTPWWPRLLLNTVWLASTTTTFKAAKIKPGVLSDGDLERKG